MSVNKLIVLGRLGQDPTELGASGARFSVATTDRWTDKSGTKKEETDWHNVICFGQIAGFVLKYMKKGDNVFVEGKSKIRKFEKDGVTHYAHELKAEVVHSLANKSTDEFKG
jgi:single-strand DNA-binding protein